jgi:hypothetical protein
MDNKLQFKDFEMRRLGEWSGKASSGDRNSEGEILG